jgi:hypothetical protein
MFSWQTTRVPNKITFSLLAGFLLFIFLSAWLVAYVPVNTDELLPYHRIACTVFPMAVEHAPQGVCGAYASQILGFDFYRSYSYVGFSSNILYQPFYKVLPIPFSHHFLGILVLLVFSFLLVRAFSLSIFTIVIPLIYFPLLYQVIHDTGPIRIALLSFPIAIILAISALSPSTTTARMTLIFLATFFTYSVAIEDKPFYVYLIPQVILLSFWAAYDRYGRIEIKSQAEMKVNKFNVRIKVLSKFLLLGFAVFLAGYVTLILTTEPAGGAFYPYLKSLMIGSTPNLSFFQELEYLVMYLASPILFTSRIFEISTTQLLLSALAFLPVLLLFIYAVFEKKNRNRRYIFASLLLLIIIFLITKKTWSGHHFVYLHIPIVIFLMIYASNGPRRYMQVIIALILSALVSWGQVLYAKEHIHSETGRKVIFDYLSQNEIASASIINFTSWGGYYQQSLYGADSQLVTYTEPITSDGMNLMRELLVKTGRKYLINVCYDCDKGTFQPYFHADNIEVLYFPSTSWRLIKITQQSQ